MKKYLLAVLLLCTAAFGQQFGGGGGTGAAITGTPTAGHCANWADATHIQDSGGACGANPTFNLVGAGTNANALLVGTGGSLGPSGTGAITATTVPSGGLNFPGSTSGTAILKAPATAGTPTFTLGTVTGTIPIAQTCTNKLLSAIDGAGTAGNCVTVTSAFVDTSIALTGVDINTSNQVTATHLGSALPVNQGGTGTTATLTGLVRGSASAFTAAELSGDATTSGSNAVTVAKINGNSVPSGAAAHQTLIATGASTFSLKTINDCTGGTNALTYAQSTDAYGCLANVITGAPTSTQVLFASGTSAATGSANFIYASASGVSMVQGANAADMFFGNRFTDTTPTGNFLHFQNTAKLTDLFKVDVSGNVTAVSYNATNPSGNAGMVSLVQGTAPSAVSNAVNLQAPSSVTTYTLTFPTAAAAGIWRQTSGGTISFAELSGDATTSASNVVTVAKVNGVAFPTTGASFDALPILTASNSVSYFQINGGSSCGDSTHALSYSISTHLFGCQAITAAAPGAGGSNTQVQFNSSNTLAGSANLTWVSPTLTVGAAGSATGIVAFGGSTSGTTSLTSANAAGGTWTLRNATDNVVGAATTDTLTNKTYDTAGTGNVFKANGSQGTTGQLLRATTSSSPQYIDYPDVKIIPAANCNNATAGAAWSLPASNAPTSACRAGTNNLGGVLQWPNNNTTTNAQFTFELPADWDTGTQPFINIIYGSGANTSGTVKWTFSTACTKSDGSITDDPAFVAESASTGKTMAVANREWAENLQFTAVTSGNNCVAGSTVLVKVTSGNGTATSSVNVEQVTITVPRLLVVQAN